MTDFIQNSENKIQSDSFQWFHNEHTDLRGLLYHVPNGGARDKIEAARLKGAGVVKGVPDMVLHYKAKTWFFEFKTPTGKVSPEQAKIHDLMRSQGFVVWIVRSVEHFKELIGTILNGDQVDKLKVGLTKERFYYRHNVFNWLYTETRHNDLYLIDDLAEANTKILFIETLREFIAYRYDEKDNFELLFTPDFEAFYRRDIGKEFEPIFYKGKSIIENEA